MPQDKGPVVGSCECCNEPSGPIKGKEFLNYLSNYQLLKKGSVLHGGRESVSQFSSA
jgi:hypothetical protein